MSNLIITGFMGTGKTVVGRMLARRMGLRFVDCDELIERRAGTTISEIFRRQGEPAFRAMERKIVREVTEQSGQVIATGGGAVKDPRNVRRLRGSGTMICLHARPEVIWRRLKHMKDRPLLRVADQRKRIEELLAERARFYAKADLAADTSDFTPAQVVRRIQEALQTVRVELGERSYDIRIGAGLLGTVGPALAAIARPNRAAIVTHPEIDHLYGDALRRSLAEAGIPCCTVGVPPGERSKSFAQARRLHGLLLEAGLDRGSAVLALGGGVIGDLAGFVAATFMRGIDYVQLPTTLLAQVDASVGGKVAVNHPRGKNLVGCFYQPRIVIADLDTLSSLPRRHLRNGLAEVVKTAIIADEALFDYLERWGEQVARLEPLSVSHVVRRCCQIKANVVAADEREAGLRAILNFGHTFGHALEAARGYRMLHGQAVSVGMAAAARLSVRMGLLRQEEADRIERLLHVIGLPVRMRRSDAGALLRYMAADKKARAGRLRFVLAKGLGGAVVRDDVPGKVLSEVLTSLTNGPASLAGRPG